MNCPQDEVLLARIEGAKDIALTDHLGNCAPCAARLATLAAGLAHARDAAVALADATPASLEAKLRFRLRTGATTLDAQRPNPLYAWLGRHRTVLAGAAALAAAVVVAFLVAGPTPEVSAAQVIERSQAALLAPIATSGAERLAYAIHYEGPSFGWLPEGSGDYRLEAVRDHDQAGRFKVAFLGPDGQLLRGLVQDGHERRLILRTPQGAFDLHFQVAGEVPPEDLLESRRQQIAKTLFDTLTRAAAPERLGVIERADAHILELGAPVTGSPDAVQGFIEVERARVVLDHDTYRPRSAEAAGQLMGEPFRIEVRVALSETLPSAQLAASEFTLPAIDGAVVLEGQGSSHPMADATALLLAAAHAGHAPAAK